MFNELEVMRNRLLTYIESSYHLSDSQLVSLRHALLEEPEVFCHSPFIESSARYASGRPYSELSIPQPSKELLTHLSSAAGGEVVFPVPYEHQADALESVLGKELRHTIVTTGTGSGKTETFLLPILGRLAKEAAENADSFGCRAVRAILLYPMNALVNDQLSRLRRLLGSTGTRDWFTARTGRPVKFGRYTSRTPFPGVIPDDNSKLKAKLDGLSFFTDLERDAALGDDAEKVRLLEMMRRMGKWPAKDNGTEPGLAAWLGSGHWRDAQGNLKRAIERLTDTELLTRHEIQTAPPDVLVTNYSMLEYMMLRPIERGIFDATRDFFSAYPEERFILVLDEAHLYRGAQGTEVAMLIRRLRERLRLQENQFQVITTSASFNDSDAAMEFAAGLSGTSSKSFVCLSGRQVPQEPSGAGTIAEADSLACVDLERLLRGTSLDRFAAIEPLGTLSPSVAATIPSAASLTEMDIDAANIELARVLFSYLADLPVTGRLLNLTSRSPCVDDHETDFDLGAQELSVLAKRLFPDVEVAVARRATDVLVEAASIARKSASETPLLAARVHRFFRGIPGIWACSNIDCSELPEPQRGGLTGRLFVQPQRVCGCGSRVFELLACKSCGSPFFLAYTRNPRRPEYLWQEDVGEVDGVDGTVVPLHLWLENSVDLNIDSDQEADVRDVDLEPLTGRILESVSDSKTVRPVCIPPERKPGRESGLFTTCPRCRGRYSRISNMATKGDEPFQHLLAAQLLSQPPHPGNTTALEGRKLLVFSDGRQPASRLAGKLKANSLRDAVRPLLISGLKYVAERWFDNDTTQVSLQHAYVALLCGARTRSVVLRPQLLAQEQVFYQHLHRTIEVIDSTTADRTAFEGVSSTLSSQVPESIQKAIYEVLFNPLTGVHALAIGKLTPLLSPFVREAFERLPIPPEPAAITSDSQRREALMEFWMHRMARNRAVWLPGTNPEWVGSSDTGAHINLDSGKFMEEMTYRVGRTFYNQQLSGGKQGTGQWRQFYSDRLGRGGQGGEFLLDVAHVSLDCHATDWLRCRICTSVFPASPIVLDRCPECRCKELDRLTPDNAELFDVFETRSGFYRSSVVDESTNLRPFVAEEHTAAIGSLDSQDAFSRAEWHEMRFQDLEVEGPDGTPGGIVDVLSCTTTMEVGIDIGSLTAVSLRNVPPNRANYQQRAGRAGRRGSSLSTVITYADQGTHDQRYFAKPAEMISGPVTDPVLNLDNLEIVRRHGFAMILSLFQQERISTQGTPSQLANIFSSLGKVRDFRTGGVDEFSFEGLESWINQNQQRIIESLQVIAPEPYLEGGGSDEIQKTPMRLLERLREIGCGQMQAVVEQTATEAAVVFANQFDDIIEDEDPVVLGQNSSDNDTNQEQVAASPAPELSDAGRQTENLLDLLFDTATLPSYAFPTDVVSLTVFDQNRSSDYRAVVKYGPQRGLDQALSSYAPGREVFIDGYRHYSFAIWSPIPRDRTRSWDQRELYFECRRCGYAALERLGEQFHEGQCLDCPSCGELSGLGPSLYWIEPPGFAHPIDIREDLPIDEPPDLTRPTQAKLNAPFNDSSAAGEYHGFGDRGFTCWTAKEQLFLTNRGPEEQINRGFHYCLRCGRIEPRGWQSAQARLGQRGNHLKPYPNHRNQPNCAGFIRTVSLGTRFISDVSLFRFHLGSGVLLGPGSNLAKTTLTTIAQAIGIVAANLLEIDLANIGAEYRAAQTVRGKGGAEVDIYLYDTTPGGAGFVKAAAKDSEKLIREALDLLEGCDCEGSCYRCLRSYNNRFHHPYLDRSLGASLLRHVLNLESVPFLDPKTEDDLLKVLAQDLCDSGEEAHVKDGFLLMPQRNNRRIVLAHALLPGRAGSDRGKAAIQVGRNNALPIDHVRVQRALPAAVEDCLAAATQAAVSADMLPDGLTASDSGQPLHSFQTLQNAWPANPLHVVACDSESSLPDEAFFMEMSGPQLERFRFKIGAIEYTLQQGTIIVLEKCDEVASQAIHDRHLLLVCSEAETFIATHTKATLANCIWSTFDNRVSIRLQYLSSDSRAIVQKCSPEGLKVIARPIGILHAGRFHKVPFA